MILVVIGYGCDRPMKLYLPLDGFCQMWWYWQNIGPWNLPSEFGGIVDRQKTISPIFGDSKSSVLLKTWRPRGPFPTWMYSKSAFSLSESWSTLMIGSTDRSVRNFFSYSANMQTRCQDFRFHRCAIVTRVALDLGPLLSPVAIFRQQQTVGGRWLMSLVAIFSSMHPILGVTDWRLVLTSRRPRGVIFTGLERFSRITVTAFSSI